MPEIVVMTPPGANAGAAARARLIGTTALASNSAEVTATSGSDAGPNPTAPAQHHDVESAEDRDGFADSLIGRRRLGRIRCDCPRGGACPRFDDRRQGILGPPRLG
jgi:hypothetical protein